MINRVTLVGRLGKDPETRYTASGQAVANFTVATDESFKDRNGEKQQRTEWHRIVAWGKLAEIIQQYLKKGQLVYLEGKLQTRQWDNKEGVKMNTTEIVASTMKMLGGGNGGGEQQTSRPAASAQSSGKPTAAGASRGGYKKPAPAAARPAEVEEPVGISDEAFPFS